MTRYFGKTLRRFGRDQDGQILIEFILLVPLIFTIFLTSVELGMYQIRQMFLDRGMDVTVRMVRLNTGADYTHTDLKTLICENAGFLENCEDQLKLEMNPVDLRNFSGFAGAADCTDASQPVQPNRSFVHGTRHQMMLMRACYKFRPIFPTSGLGFDLAENGDGSRMAKMVSLSAFVQEP